MITQVTLRETSVRLYKNKSKSLKITIVPATASVSELEWSSSNPDIVAVNPCTGVITAIEKGEATITVSSKDDSSVRDTCVVTVMVMSDSVEIEPNNVTIASGEEVLLAGIVLPYDAEDRSVTWESSDTSILTIRPQGYDMETYSDYVWVSGRENGTATITATANDGSGEKATCTVNVVGNRGIIAINVNPSSVVLGLNDSMYLDVDIIPSSISKSCVEWSSSEPNIVAVNPSSGVITALAKGVATITATSKENREIYASCTVTVMVLAEYIEIDPNNVTIGPGQEVLLAGIVSPHNADDRSVTWESSDTSIANIVPHGYDMETYSDYVSVFGRNNGTATITATANDGSGVKATCTVNVVGNQVIRQITVNPSNVVLEVDKSMSLDVDLVPSSISKSCVEWISSNPDVVSVSESDGIITALAKGEATITARAKDLGGAEGTCTVKAVVLADSVEITPNPLKIAVGETGYIYGRITPLWASDHSVTWEKNKNPSIIDIEEVTNKARPEFSYLSVTGLKEGLATLKAITNDGSEKDVEGQVIVGRDPVIVEKDGDTSNRIVFSDGRVWNCINTDIIYDYTLDMNDSFSQRFYDNVYQTKVIDDGTGQVYYYKPMKEYTDDEIKLIYTIDPYGLAAYVREYAEKKPTAGDTRQKSLEKIFEYKDKIFKLLFKRDPKYYARSSVGNWYPTTDKSDLSAVISESEYLFGFNALWDEISIAQIISTALELFVDITGIDKTLIGGLITEIINIGLDLWAGQDPFELEDIAEDIIDKQIENEMTNAMNLWSINISLMQSLDELEEVLSDRPGIYSTMIPFISDYDNQDIKFNIVFKLADGQMYSAAELNDLI